MSFELRDRPKTFYTASRFANWPAVRAFGGKLVAGYGMTCYHDWTLREKETPLDDPVAPLLAQREIKAASNADLFVKLLTPDFSPGAFGELGARLALGRIAHLIEGGQKKHLFHMHPLIRRYRDEAHFFERLDRFLDGRALMLWPEDDVKQLLYSRDPF